MSEYVLAIDIGGTNVKAGLVDRAGNVSHMIHTPSRAAEGRDALFDVLRAIIQEQKTRAPIVAVGCGSPGCVDHYRGTIVYMQAHIPNWSGVPLARYLADWAGVPATIDNDVNLIALGEHWLGAGRGAACQLSLALGTGLGGGIVINGRLVRGARGRAAEFGHVVVRPGGEPCTCGNFGCAEVYAAPGAMARRAQWYLKSGVPTALHSARRVSAEEIITLAAQGDHLCRKLFHDALTSLAQLIWILTQTFDPDLFVIGGGMVKAGDAFFKPLRQELSSFYAAPELQPMVTIKASELGDNAGIVGAAKLAWDWLDGIDRS
ncbi:MAG: ROK family protein [bacterium]|nr:ROK family protein [bacterium]